MAFRVRYVPLSPQGSKPRAMTSETELKPFEFVPLSQDIINKAKKGFEDLINELCPLPTPEQTSFAHNDFSNFASTSTFPFDDMQSRLHFFNPTPCQKSSTNFIPCWIKLPDLNCPDSIPHRILPTCKWEQTPSSTSFLASKVT
ncbi:hypothetical protein JR316_0005326 [Psilocybe cubensis]|uniref:Uncharacterized protein n=1 Tax=Psilocybe cubensis TaxID=181762 RepID=A0ACB8H6G3_PSICU|nr:hypothetical protein JR316_0005326 [Psilocybe cubensis]KAH9483222.1 hypothetical protein JR316_0005326 [Psilocybe cubensis]